MTRRTEFGSAGQLGRRMLGAAAGLLLDRILGELPARIHPVVMFGKSARRLEDHIWSDSFLSGSFAWTFLLGTIWLVGSVPSESIASVALSTYLATAERSLLTEAGAVADLLEVGDIEGARGRLLALVGRDRDSLDTTGIARAVVESVAENTVDAVVAPLFWSAVFGARGALAYRAINTLDSMFGHRSEMYRRFGWASARTDDLANYIPARIVLLLASYVGPIRQRPAAALEDARLHPSPNAGVAEASFARALSVRLGGSLSYSGVAESRPILAPFGSDPKPSDVRAAIRLSRRLDTVISLVLLVLGLLLVGFDGIMHKEDGRP